MPLAEAGTSSKAGEDSPGRGEPKAENRAAPFSALTPVQPIPVQPSIFKKLRREATFRASSRLFAIHRTPACVPSLCRVIALLGRLRALRVLRRPVSLQSHFPISFLLASGARVGRGELVVSCRIPGLHLYVALQRRNRVGELSC